MKSGYDRTEKLLIVINNEHDVILSNRLAVNGEREMLAHIVPSLPRIYFGDFQDIESMNIGLQSKFEDSKDRNTVLAVIGNLKEETVNNYGDDGTSQSVTAKTGIAQVDNVRVPNPVNLAPYRTFSEVAQPLSPFIFRMRKGPEAALFEADGGAWKLEAMQNIKEYLTDNLAEEITADKVMVIA